MSTKTLLEKKTVTWRRQWWKNPKKIREENERLRNKWTSRNHPDYSIIKIGQNTEKSPGDLRRLAVTEIPEENYQLTVMGKTLKGINNNNNNNNNNNDHAQGIIED